MLCEQCGQNEANVVFTKTVNGNKTVHNLCQSCMQKEGKSITDHFPGIMSVFSSLLQDVQVPQTREIRCEKCGMSWADFKKSGEVGCAECYKAFRSQLMPVLKRVHGNSKHAGKVPSSAPETAKNRGRAEELRKRLSAAISAENYEEAAALRDALRELETEAVDN